MIALLRQLLAQAKNLLGGAFATSVGGLTESIPSGLFDMGIFTNTTSIMGFTVPSFILYLIFSDD